MTRTERLVLLALVAVTVLLRVVFNDVAAYSTADERHYVELTRVLVDRGYFAGYRQIVVDHLADSGRWIYPPPLRWGYLTLTWLSVLVFHSCEPRALAWLSALAGVAIVPLTFAVGQRLVGARAGLFGAALCVTSPILCAMSRRALSDAPFCAVALWALWALLRKSRIESVLALTLLFAIKETAFLLYPALLVTMVLGRREAGRPPLRELVVLGLPPILYVLVGSALSRSLADFLAVARTPLLTIGATYPELYQNGPPHRLLLDLFALAPYTCMAALAGAVLAFERKATDARTLTYLTLAVLTVFCLSPSKNLRYVILADPLLRLLAGWLCASLSRTPMAIGLTTLDGLYELSLFSKVFLVKAVYDPVSDNILRALRIIP